MSTETALRWLSGLREQHTATAGQAGARVHQEADRSQSALLHVVSTVFAGGIIIPQII